MRKPELATALPVMQTLALCQRAMEEENDLLTMSHEGVRQLMATTGMLPRNVATAEWARFGLASFFEVPHFGFYPSTGGPNWEHLVNFKALAALKKVEQKDATAILLKVITDEYFRKAYDNLKKAEDAKEDRLILTLKHEEEQERARSTDWS